MMRDFVLYLQEWVIFGLLLLAALKLLAMHGLPLSHNENQKDFATNSPKRENANELDDEIVSYTNKQYFVGYCWHAGKAIYCCAHAVQ